MRRILLLLPLLLLSGCVLFESRAERARKFTPDYKAGYRDGCASSGNRGADPRDSGILRDEAAFDANPDYHAGWSTGFNACRMYTPTGGASPDRGPIADPTPNVPF